MTDSERLEFVKLKLKIVFPTVDKQKVYIFKYEDTEYPVNISGYDVYSQINDILNGTITDLDFPLIMKEINMVWKQR